MMKYRANPVEVDAFRIAEVGPNVEGGGRTLRLDDGQVVLATPEMMARLTPAPGDYWVVQADGYVYLNPKDVFERKYTPLY
jgi:hypothetical protein